MLNFASAENKGSTMKDVLYIYSYTGNTEIVAKALAESINADLVKIEDVQRPSKGKAYTPELLLPGRGNPGLLNLLIKISPFMGVFL